MDATISIADVLAQDLLARQNESVRDKDLISIRELNAKEWDYSAPTIVESYRDNFDLNNRSMTVIRKFLIEFPFFEEVNMKNILIAGGSVTACITNRVERDMDVDLFIYGLEMKDVLLRIEELVSELDIPKEGTIIKTAFATTILFKVGQCNKSIQIVHRLYKNPSEVLHGFDLGSCSTGILLDQNKVVMTSLAKVSLEYSINIWDTTKRSTTYDYRLEKYSDRGFRIVLPDLDMSKMHLGEIHFYESRLFISGIKGNMINGRYSDYTNKKVYFADYLPEKIDIRASSQDFANLMRVLRGKGTIYHRDWKSKDELVKCISDTQVKIPEKCIDQYLTLNFYRNGVIYTNKLKNIFGMEETIYWVTQLMISKGSYEVEETIKGAAKKRIHSVLEAKDLSYRAHWVTLNPASQITGSFQPKVVTKEQFYGEYLKM